MNPQGPFTFFVFRPLSDLVLWLWRLERRIEFLYRPRFDRWLRPPLFAAAQWLQNLFRRRRAPRRSREEKQLADEERAHQRDHRRDRRRSRGRTGCPASAQRFGNTKTFGVLRGRVHRARRTSRTTCGTACSPSPGTYPAWVRFSGPGPYAPPDLEDFGQCSVGIKVMGVPGPKLMDDEQAHPGPDPGHARPAS